MVAYLQILHPEEDLEEVTPDWGTAFIQLPWNMFLYYGDKSVISEHYAGMSFFMDYLQKIAAGNIIYAGIGSLFFTGKNYARRNTKRIYFYSALLFLCRSHVPDGPYDRSGKRCSKVFTNSKEY